MTGKSDLATLFKMKRIILATGLLILLSTRVSYLEAQDSIFMPKSRYKTWISLVNIKRDIKGVLYEVRDTSIVLIHYSAIGDRSLQKLTISEINFNMLNSVKTRNKYAPVTGALLGALGGGLLGGLFGHYIYKNTLWSNYPYPSEAKFIIGCGLYFGVPLGASVGTLLGLNRNLFILNGDKNKYIKRQAKLKKYSYLH